MAVDREVLMRDVHSPHNEKGVYKLKWARPLLAGKRKETPERAPMCTSTPKMHTISKSWYCPHPSAGLPVRAVGCSKDQATG